MNKYVVAVSGGVDSVVLLDILVKKGDNQLIVAHFDHGIREDSAIDTEFVRKLSAKYKLPFETKREELGPSVGEATARYRRYDFLRSLAKKYKAKVVTAHHIDDIVETVVINIMRGTGWRGLAVLDSDIFRPLTNMTKSEIIHYANDNNLKWHEDSTNNNDDYLRNRIRKQTIKLSIDEKLQILALWSAQKEIKSCINEIVSSIIDAGPTYSRKIFQGLEKPVAHEVIRHITNGRLTRPQQQKALDAILTFLPSKVLQAGGGINLIFTTRNFTVKLVK